MDKALFRRETGRACAQRIEWVDTAKGIGLFLVVLGHLWYSSDLAAVHYLLYSFHVPMFFILSGFVFTNQKNQSFLTYAAGKIKRFIPPIILGLMLGVAIMLGRNSMAQTEMLLRIFYWNGKLPYNAPVWFLIILFEVYFFAYWLPNDHFSYIRRALFAAVCLAVGYVFTIQRGFVPFGMDRMIICFGFFLLGNVARPLYDKLAKGKAKALMWTMLGIFCVSLPIWIVFAGVLNPVTKLSMYSFVFGNYGYFVVSAISGSLMAISIAFFINKTKKDRFIQALTRSSIFVIVTHYPFAWGYRYLAAQWGFEFTWIYSLTAIIYAALVLAFYMAITPFVSRVFPVVTGDTK